MRSHRSLLGLAAGALIAAAAYAAGLAVTGTSRAIDYGASMLRSVYDFVVTPFLSLAQVAPDFSREQRTALGGAITQAQARSFMQRLMQRESFKYDTPMCLSQ